MAPGDATLLCLVLCLGRGSQEQEGVSYPAPTISAWPGPVVPRNQSVQIRCRGASSFVYQLELLRGAHAAREVVGSSLGSREEAEFRLQRVDTGQAGSYRCRYRGHGGWSERSAALELAVTGFYSRPLLSPRGRLVAQPGERLSLRCSSPHVQFDGFSLAKEGGTAPPSPKTGDPGGNFSLGPVDPGFSGNYSCYGWFQGNGSVWSEPSDALQLVFSGLDAGDGAYTLENVVRLCLAGLVMVALMVLLVQHWLSGPAQPQGPQGAPAEPDWSPKGQQVAWTFRPPPPGGHPSLKQK